MDFTIRQGKSHNGDDIQLMVDQIGPDTVRVHAGSFRLSDTDYTLDEEYLWVMDVTAERTWVNGFVAEDPSNGNIFILVDEFTYGVADEIYGWKDSPYRCIHGLFSFEVPASAPNLDDLQCQIDHIIPVGGG